VCVQRDRCGNETLASHRLTGERLRDTLAFPPASCELQPVVHTHLASATLDWR
jgi:hypothetical protein